MLVDIFIVILLLWAAFSGWRNGLLREVSSALGFLVGLLVASLFYSQFAEWLAVDGSEVNMLTSIAAFMILWIVVPIVFGFLATLLTKTLRGLHLGFLNSTLGALVSIVKYMLLLACVLCVMDALHILNRERTADSHLFAPATRLVQTFLPVASASDQDADVEEQPDTVWIPMNQKQQ